MKKWGIIIGSGIGGALLCFFFSAVFLKGKNYTAYNMKYHIQAMLKQPYEPKHAGIPMDKIMNQIRFRLDGRKIKFNIERTGSDEAIVSINNQTDTNLLRAFIFNRGRIGFWEVYHPWQVATLVEKLLLATRPVNDTSRQANEPADSLAKELAALKKSVSDEAIRVSNQPAAGLITFAVGADPDFSPSPISPEIGYVQPSDTGKINSILRSPEFRALTPADMDFAWGTHSINKETRQKDRLPLYFLRYSAQSNNVLLSNEDILHAEARASNDLGPLVTITFTKKGQTKWKYLTGKNIGKYVAIQFDEIVFTCPRVESQIDNPSTNLTGNFSEKESFALAEEMQTMPLTVPIVIKSTSAESVGRKFINSPIFLMGVGFLFFGGLALFLFKALKNT